MHVHDITTFLVLIVVILLYFVPTIIAAIRGVRHDTGIALLNVFLGWTFLGWVGALVWAVSDSTREAQA